VDEIPDSRGSYTHSDFSVLHNLALFGLFRFESGFLGKRFRGILFRLSIIELQTCRVSIGKLMHIGRIYRRTFFFAVISF